jgi:uncharacterized RDD family membrane protein YckC
VKCPKCEYLGFDTGDRCRNCGYDFSLLALADAPPDRHDVMLRPAAEQTSRGGEGAWLDVEIEPAPPAMVSPPGRLERRPEPVVPSGNAATVPRSSRAGLPEGQDRGDLPLPLFPRTGRDDDEPLITLPTAPRPPLSVRRTPEIPRVKAPSPVERRGPRMPKAFEVAESPGASSHPDLPLQAPSTPASPAASIVRLSPDAASARRRPERPAATLGETRAREAMTACGPGPRAAAALIDAGILFAIDLAVVYFTLRMAALPTSEWRLLPPVPLIAFLVLLKFAYFSAFTAFGGQTIGKMAARIRVIADDETSLQPSRAVQRTFAALGSVLTLGAGFAPALVGPGGRALHDRVARTRVVALPST